MTASATTADTPALPSREVSWIWLRHLTSILFPATGLAFVLSGPHPWYVAPLFMAPLVLAFWLDKRPVFERRQPAASLPAWPFDALVYLLAALQLGAVFALVAMFAHQALFSVDTVMAALVVGSSSGFSIITAHELIHREKRWEQQLGRLLLCTVLYEHFYTEHLRGHHVRVGTPEDPATARFGEPYESFFRRTVPAQFRSAWRLEARRLGDERMSLLDRRMLRNRILHGLALEWGLALAAWAAFGFAAFAVYVVQAFMAVRLLEAVNYFEHWGLLRRARRIRPVDSWDTHSWFTYYSLVGLSRHADHHAFPQRPYQQLRVFDEVPVLPSGYVGTIDLVMARNDEFRRAATEELERRRLGPFAPDAPPEEAAQAQALAAAERAPAAEAPAPARGALGRRWAALPAPARVALFLLGFAAAVSLGAWIEAGGAGPGLGARFALSLWILAVFAVVIRVRRLVEDRGQFGLSWVAAFGLLVVLGILTERVLGG